MTLMLLAPIKGWVGRLEEVPDAVFSERMLGDGVAIDPTGSILHAPCDAEVVSVAPARHAVTLRAENGVEILIHIGLETVFLAGDGFTAHIQAGQNVKAGDPLISFDLDFLARRAKSLLTPILIINFDAVDIIWQEQGREAEVGDPLMTLRVLAPSSAGLENSLDYERRATVSLGFPHGLHARPAGRVAALAKSFQADVSVLAAGRAANAKSPIALMTLGASHGQGLELSACGIDSIDALNALSAFLSGDGGESDAWPIAPPHAFQPPSAEGVLSGVCAAPGHAIGPTFRFKRSEIRVAAANQGVALETQAFEAALALAKYAFSNPTDKTGLGAEVMAAHLAFLSDPELRLASHAGIVAGDNAGTAWSSAVDAQIGALHALANPRLRARAQDLIDLKRRVLIALGGEVAAPPEAPDGVILLADDLLPSELLAVGGRIKGLCTAAGGPTSHVAIIAGSLGLPAVVAMGREPLGGLADGTMVILDATAGTLTLDPPDADLVRQQEMENGLRAERTAAKAASAIECRMADGTRIQVFANLASVADASAAVAMGAEGCGLLRSEFLFMDRAAAPDEDEQLRAYQAIADALGGRPFIIRTLDIGGDKPVAYLPLPAEENPALGLRGVRTSLWRPNLLRTQLRAIVRVRPIGVCKIMIPMVASLHELVAVRAMLDEERQALGFNQAIPLGAMVETPAAAVTVAAIAMEADFLSIGANDLTQYALAMDRGNAALAAEVDALHPAVLRLISLACEGAQSRGRCIGVCGALASEPLAAPLLIGLGATELSVTPSSIPSVKSAVRAETMTACRRLAQTALGQTSAAGVRALLAEAADKSLKAAP